MVFIFCYNYIPDLIAFLFRHFLGESGNLLPYGAEVKKEWRYTSTPPYVFMAGRGIIDVISDTTFAVV